MPVGKTREAWVSVFYPVILGIKEISHKSSQYWVSCEQTNNLYK